MSTTTAHAVIVPGCGESGQDDRYQFGGQRSSEGIKRIIVAAAVLLFSLVCRAADLYKIDPTNSFICFSVKYVGLSNLKGQFRQFEGLTVLNGGLLTEARATILVKSLDTGVQRRDDYFRSAVFFDASKFPTITFETKRIKKKRVYGKRHNMWEGDVNVIGNLTMHGITRELRFTAKQRGPAKDSSGNIRIGLEAKTNLKRKDYGIAYHQMLETGVLVVGEEVEIELNLQAIKQEPRFG